MIRTIVALFLVTAFVSWPGVREANAQQKCWSARNCTGKVLSSRDCHNCKVKSRGKSWSNGGVCVPVSRCP